MTNNKGFKDALYGLRVLFHPIDTYETCKREERFSVPLSILVLVSLFLVSIFSYLNLGFGFNKNNPRELNVLIILASTILLFCLWVLSNYLFCTLMDGKGFFKEIWCACAYALIPYVLLTFVYIVASNMVVLEEFSLVSYIQMIGIFWSACLMLIGLKTIHGYSMGMTVKSILLTILGIAVTVFLMVLSFTVYQQVWSMLRTVVNEILFRM